MASIYDLKPRFQNLLRPLVVRLAGRGVTANQVTVGALVLSVAAGACVLLGRGAAWSLWLLPPALLVRMGLNAIDGMLAREHAMKSDLGAMLNEMGDVISDSVMYLPLALVPGVPPAWVVLFVLVGILSEMAGVLAALVGGERRYDGPMGKSDRALLVGTLALLLALGLRPGVWPDILLAAGTLLGLVAIWRRLRGGLA
ncbi:CDP-alcohol phosphatidyltransferase family protein [Thermodesulfobacteriota bacterium B35]